MESRHRLMSTSDAATRRKGSKEYRKDAGETPAVQKNYETEWLQKVKSLWHL